MRTIKFVHFPTLEFQYSESRLRFGSPTAIWICELILQIMTTLSSAYTAFNVIINRLFISNIKATGKAPTIPYMLCYFLKIMFQIVFQTMFLFMILWMTLFHNRWKNFRDFLTRNYSIDSVEYLSGSVIISAFMIITFGRGLI